jgi:hypothetical protein
MEDINIKKAPGFDLISGKELSEKCYKLITFIFNAILKIKLLPQHLESHLNHHHP